MILVGNKIRVDFNENLTIEDLMFIILCKVCDPGGYVIDLQGFDPLDFGHENRMYYFGAWRKYDILIKPGDIQLLVYAIANISEDCAADRYNLYGCSKNFGVARAYNNKDYLEVAQKLIEAFETNGYEKIRLGDLVGTSSGFLHSLLNIASTFDIVGSDFWENKINQLREESR